MFRAVCTGVILMILVASMLIPDNCSARALPGPGRFVNPQPTTTANDVPAFCEAAHNVGNISLVVNNAGRFGNYDQALRVIDCFTGQLVPVCEYPRGSNTRYLYVGCFWIGAIVGRDTLVSTGGDGWTPSMYEFYPEGAGNGDMVRRSIKDPDSPLYDGAVSEQDYIAVYYDTFTTSGNGVTLDADFCSGRTHRPLGIRVEQRSYSWSYSYAEDFVLFDYRVQNISTNRLRNVYMGFYVDADVHIGTVTDGSGASDDLCGFQFDLPTHEQFNPPGCGFRDTVRIAYIMDNNGDPLGQDLNAQTSVPNVTAMRVVRAPSDTLTYSFNWWISNEQAPSDFGPRYKANIARRPDMCAGNRGTPMGDAPKYFIMSNNEFDYDQIETSYHASIAATDTLFESPGPDAGRFSKGYDTRYLLSFGPFIVEPGQTLPLSFAYIGGEDFHRQWDNWSVNLDAGYNPGRYKANLDFTDLGLNATWADWIYDNPGVDTDTNGDSGRYRLCDVGGTPERFWYRGDNVPDFRGANPPPPPDAWLHPEIGRVRIRFNGARSETAIDNFSQKVDFEGYRIYTSLDSRASSYHPLISYDRVDYNRFVFDTAYGAFRLKDVPFTLTELQDAYGGGDPGWDPLQFTRTNPLVVVTPDPSDRDSVMYFELQDFNNGMPTKLFPDTVTYPRPPDSLLQWLPAQVPADLPADYREKYFTNDNYLKFYEYEYVVENLLPTVARYFTVTAFDYGSPSAGLASLETAVNNNTKRAYALANDGTIDAANLKTYVYPNPYRLDGGYRRKGFEDTALARDRSYRIHFANLPPQCAIRIYTLDGDLVREIIHDASADPWVPSHDTWDLITRNTQLAVSGIYYWTVEEPNGKVQIGKLVLIM